MIQYATVKVPSTFPPQSRPIYLYPIADVTYKNKTQAYPILLSGVAEIMARNPSSKCLVHTVSYDLTKYLQTNLRSKRTISYTTANDRQRAIDIYLSQDNAVLLAPSLDRGIDLPNDDCRAIVVCKVPFPNLGDKQISARLHSRNGQLWYSVSAVRSLVQMTGRGFRHENDYCESYILDKQFINVWKKNKALFPEWWSSALIWDAGKLIN